MKKRRNAPGRPPPSKSSAKNVKYPAERILAGHHAIAEALRAHARDCVEIWTTERQLPPKIFERAQRLSVKIKNVLDDDLKKFGQHQGVVLFAKPLRPFDLETLTHERSTVLILDEIEDPHNLGAILRTCWLMGVDGIIMSNRRTVSLSAAAHKVASGGAEHVPILSVPSFGPTFQLLKERGFWIYGLSGEAPKTISQIRLSEKIAWVLGAEESGLRSTTEKLCDELVSLPQVTREASYNVSVAAALALSFGNARAKV